MRLPYSLKLYLVQNYASGNDFNSLTTFGSNSPNLSVPLIVTFSFLPFSFFSSGKHLTAIYLS